MNEKECTKCKELLSIDNFYKERGRKDGYSQWCKDCKREYEKSPKYKALRKKYSSKPNYKFIAYKARAKFKGREFELTYEEFTSYWDSTCFYCGQFIKGIGLDRLSSKKGYTIDNIVPCCWFCNRMKMDSSREEFLEQVEKIYKYNKQLP